MLRAPLCLRFACLIALLGVAACSGVDPGTATGKEIAAAATRLDDRPFIAVVSMVNRQSGRAAHTAMFIHGSQTVIHDPAGTFEHPAMPERGDVHYGATARLIDYYERYHARFSHFVHVQKVYVPAETAEAVLRRAANNGATPKMFCTAHTINILSDVPGLPPIAHSFFPERLRRQVATWPGVENRYVYENDLHKGPPVETAETAG